MPSSTHKIAVIGSGFGGLSAALRLQTAGYDVKIFEKRDRPGGRAYFYKDNGFHFDAGPTVITAPHCLEELFTEAGRKFEDYITLLPVTPFYRLLWDDGYSFEYDSSIESTLEQIRKKSPTDVEGYKLFLKYSEEVFNQGYVKLVAEPFLDWFSMMKVTPQLVKLKAYRSVYDMVGHYIKDEHLRQAFSFHSLLVGGNPFVTSSIYTLIHFLERKWGVYFAKGGTAAIIEAMIRLFEERGGKIELNAPIDGVECDGNKIKGVVYNGKFEAFNAVVSNADVVHTFSDLLRKNSVGARKGRKLKNKHFSMSLFLIYFGTRKKYPDVAHHTVLFGPRYKELLNDIFSVGTLPDDFSLYLHAPTKTDPQLAPEGCEGFYVLAPVSHLGKLNIDWEKQGPIFAEKILEYLEKKCLPGLRENIVTKRIFTPKDFSTELNAHVGSAFSLEPRLTQSAYFRVSNRDPDIKGLYFVGAGTHPGAGVPGVVNSAKATVKLMIDDLQ